MLRPWRLPLYNFKRKPYYLTTAVRQAVNHLQWEARAAVGRRSPASAPVLLFTEARCGSEFFCDCLGSTGEYSVQGEVLNPWATYGVPPRISGPSLALRHIQMAIRGARRRPVLKVGLSHLDWVNLRTSEILESSPRARPVILWRQDLLKQYVSASVLIRSGQHRIADASKRMKYLVSVTPEKYEEFCRSNAAKFTQAVLCCKKSGHDFNVVRFETMIQDPNRVFSESILPFLGSKPADVSTGTVKQNTRSIEECIENWSEVGARLNSQRYMCWGEKGFEMLPADQDPGSYSDPSGLLA